MSMKSASTGALSGCIVWVIVFGLVSMCLCPISTMVAGVTSAVSADFVAQTVGPALCPANTTPQIHTFETTTTDENGFESPATGYEMYCVDENGELVQNAGPTYAFVWVGLLGLIGLIISALLAFLLAAPAGVIAARFFNRNGSS
jgi:hypothetical protein